MACRYLELLAAVDALPDSATAYCSLGNELRAEGETVMLGDGRLMTKQGLYVEAIRCSSGGANDDTECARALCNLGAVLATDEAVTLADGRTLTRTQLYTEAIHLQHRAAAARANNNNNNNNNDNDGNPREDPDDRAMQAAPYVNLGLALRGSREVAVLPDGRVLGKREVLLEALALGSTAAAVPAALALELAPGERLRVPAWGRPRVNALQLLECALGSHECDTGWPRAAQPSPQARALYASAFTKEAEVQALETAIRLNDLCAFLRAAIARRQAARQTRTLGTTTAAAAAGARSVRSLLSSLLFSNSVGGVAPCTLPQASASPSSAQQDAAVSLGDLLSFVLSPASTKAPLSPPQLTAAAPSAPYALPALFIAFYTVCLMCIL